MAILANPVHSFDLPDSHRGEYANAVDLSPESIICQRTFKNPFFWTLFFSAASLSVIGFSITVLSPVSALGVAALSITLLALAYLCLSSETKKQILCEESLMLRVLFQLLPCSRYSWRNQITDQITLGSNPLKSHIEELCHDHQAVLSMIEPFETEPHLFGVPAKPDDWQRVGITFMNLPTPDMTPVRDADVDRGVEFLHEQISADKRVYVHCLAGVGRSATIIICYFIKYGNMTAKEAADLIHSKRAFTVNEDAPAIRSFIERLHSL